MTISGISTPVDIEITPPVTPYVFSNLPLDALHQVASFASHGSITSLSEQVLENAAKNHDHLIVAVNRNYANLFCRVFQISFNSSSSEDSKLVITAKKISNKKDLSCLEHRESEEKLFGMAKLTQKKENILTALHLLVEETDDLDIETIIRAISQLPLDLEEGDESNVREMAYAEIAFLFDLQGKPIDELLEKITSIGIKLRLLAKLKKHSEMNEILARFDQPTQNTLLSNLVNTTWEIEGENKTIEMCTNIDRSHLQEKMIEKLVDTTARKKEVNAIYNLLPKFERGKGKFFIAASIIDHLCANNQELEAIDHLIHKNTFPERYRKRLAENILNHLIENNIEHLDLFIVKMDEIFEKEEKNDILDQTLIYHYENYPNIQHVINVLDKFPLKEAIRGAKFLLDEILKQEFGDESIYYITHLPSKLTKIVLQRFLNHFINPERHQEVLFSIIETSWASEGDLHGVIDAIWDLKGEKTLIELSRRIEDSEMQEDYIYLLVSVAYKKMGKAAIYSLLSRYNHLNERFLVSKCILHYLCQNNLYGMALDCLFLADMQPKNELVSIVLKYIIQTRLEILNLFLRRVNTLLGEEEVYYLFNDALYHCYNQSENSKELINKVLNQLPIEESYLAANSLLSNILHKQPAEETFAYLRMLSNSRKAHAFNYLFTLIPTNDQIPFIREMVINNWKISSLESCFKLIALMPAHLRMITLHETLSLIDQNADMLDADFIDLLATYSNLYSESPELKEESIILSNAHTAYSSLLIN